jgi:hypothetical protein
MGQVRSFGTGNRRPKRCKNAMCRLFRRSSYSPQALIVEYSAIDTFLTITFAFILLTSTFNPVVCIGPKRVVRHQYYPARTCGLLLARSQVYTTKFLYVLLSEEILNLQ